MKLSDKACQNAKPEAKAVRLFDGEGLYLEVLPTGGKIWRLKYRFMGKEKRLTIGAYPAVTLGMARERKLEARRLLAQEKDPSEVKKEKRLEQQERLTNTFESVAREWHTYNLNGWTPKTAGYLLRRLERDVFPVIGSRPIDSITPKDILTVLKGIEARGVGEIARRCKDTCNQIFRYAILHEKCTTNPAAGFKSKDALQPIAKTHFAAMDIKEVPDFLDALEKNDARLYVHTRLAMKLMLLTFVRTTELIEARWSEFDLPNKTWLIPAERMKMRREHIVPLSTQAIEVLEHLQRLRPTWGSDEVPDYVFPNQANPRKAMSNNTILKALERMGYKGKATGHGFRALAMSTIKEKLGYRHDVIDRQLAHAPKNKVDAAYDRAQYLDERVVMMQQWGDYVMGLQNDG